MTSIFVIIGPSGVGKGTLINKLLREFPDFVIPSSYTTRTPRLNENTRKKYHFVSKDQFMENVKLGKILEYEEEHTNLYGTDKESIDQAIKDNKTIIAEIEPRGAETYRKLFGSRVKVIFISPLSLESLKKRILDDPKRGTVPKEELEIRLKTAEEEMKALPKADYVVINEDGKLEEAYQELVSIIKNAAL